MVHTDSLCPQVLFCCFFCFPSWKIQTVSAFVSTGCFVSICRQLPALLRPADHTWQPDMWHHFHSAQRPHQDWLRSAPSWTVCVTVSRCVWILIVGQFFSPQCGIGCLSMVRGRNNWPPPAITISPASLLILCPVFPDASVHGKGRQHRDEQRNLHFFAPEYACKWPGMECIGVFLGERSQLLLLLSESVDVFKKRLHRKYVKPFFKFDFDIFFSSHLLEKRKFKKKRFSQTKLKWLNYYILLYFERLLTVFPPFVSHLRRLWLSFLCL